MSSPNAPFFLALVRGVWRSLSSPHEGVATAYPRRAKPEEMRANGEAVLRYGGVIEEVAPTCVQQRTMSRIESTPASSPFSTTTRWRMPIFTIS